MKNNCTMKELYQDERPYEKCQRFGAENLTDAELLSVILRTGTKGENSLELAGKILDPRKTCQSPGDRPGKSGPDPLHRRARQADGEGDSCGRT